MKRVIVILLVLAGGGWYVFGVQTKPSVLSDEKRQQALARLLDREPVLGEKTDIADPRKGAGWKEYTGKYIHFSYPADATVYKQDKLGASMLESFSCGIVRPRLGLTVQIVTGTNLSEYPAVNLRRTQADSYIEDAGSVAGNSGFVFVKDSAEGAEKTIFFEREGHVYSVAVSGAQMKEVEKLYEQIVSSVRF